MAGKHVYTEKTITVNKEEAEELLALSEEKGLYLGAAPDTFLGASLQLAHKVGSFSLNGDTIMQDQAIFMIYGTKGILKLGDPNQFGGDIRFLPNKELAYHVLDVITQMKKSSETHRFEKVESTYHGEQDCQEK